MRQNRRCLQVFGVETEVGMQISKEMGARARAEITFFGTGAGVKKLTPLTYGTRKVFIVLLCKINTDEISTLVQVQRINSYITWSSSCRSIK